VGAWIRESTKRVYRNPFMEAHEDRYRTPNGRTLTSFRLESPPFACVVPVTDAGTIVFVKNYRPVIGGYLLEIPGGRLEPHERPREGARRELEEETGYRAGELLRLGWYYPSPARLTSRGTLFLGRKLRHGRRRPDATEDLETVEIPVAQAYQRWRRGEIHDAAGQIGLGLAEPLLFGTRRAARSKRLIPRVAGSHRSGVG
jgi:ADP-ribose pyrophosphatase